MKFRGLGNTRGSSLSLGESESDLVTSLRGEEESDRLASLGLPILLLVRLHGASCIALSIHLEYRVTRSRWTAGRVSSGMRSW